MRAHEARFFSVELVVLGNAEGLDSNANLEPERADDPAIHVLQPKFSIQPSRRRTFSGLRKLIALKDQGMCGLRTNLRLYWLGSWAD